MSRDYQTGKPNAFVWCGETEPVGLKEGDLWYDETLGKLKAKNAAGAFIEVGSGGADPWAYGQVNGGSDFTTSSATAVDVTGLSFAPSANTTYEFEALDYAAGLFRRRMAGYLFGRCGAIA